MPMIIPTPEEWFRNEKRDLYLIRYQRSGKFSKKKNMADQIALNNWFEKQLPNTPLSIIGPSEYSGWITGGPSYFTADFDSASLAIFNSAWGAGTAWKIEACSFDEWRDRIESINLLTSPGLKYKKVRWWDTSRGIFIMNAITEGRYVDSDDKASELQLTRNDGWWRLQQLIPEFSELSVDTFPSGVFWPQADSIGNTYLILDYVFNADWKSEIYAKDEEKIRHIKRAIGVPDDMAILIYDNDF
jgi:hypothetical protein